MVDQVMVDQGGPQAAAIKGTRRLRIKEKVRIVVTPHRDHRVAASLCQNEVARPIQQRTTPQSCPAPRRPRGRASVAKSGRTVPTARYNKAGWPGREPSRNEQPPVSQFESRRDGRGPVAISRTSAAVSAEPSVSACPLGVVREGASFVETRAGIQNHPDRAMAPNAERTEFRRGTEKMLL